MSHNSGRCQECGVSFTKTANFCPECGTAVSAASTTVADGESARDPSCLEWEAEMTLLNNRFFLRDATKWLAMTMAVGAALLLPIFGIPGGWGGIQAAMLILLIGLASMTMGTLIFALIMGNRLPMAFKVDAEGVNMKSVSRRMKNINRGAILLGLLARKPGVVGAGMAGRSQEDITIPWNELRKVHLYPAHRVIFLRGDIFSRIRLYCTPSNYALAEQYIRTRLSMRTTVKVF